MGTVKNTRGLDVNVFTGKEEISCHLSQNNL